MFEEIKLNNGLTIFTSKITNIDNSLLIKDLECNCGVAQSTSDGDKGPGIQSDIHVVSKNIRKLRNEIMEKVISFLKLDDNYIFSYNDWVFISENSNKYSGYHNHINEGNLKFTKEPPQWTITYYIEMPNNLKGTDGFLFFKSDNGEVDSFLPETNQLLMFGADILHKPELNKNSTNKRIVYAANVCVLDRDKKYNKLNKTLI
jgi:hypothetical protein